ncbi:hypothetical protein [Amycolatopsis sp. CA-230715]|uniref:hypothetical protein n=1 Tax=Amycolatopsis sp. CA-230715 TaxID=2745196 RepID=UPI001C022DD8|nr:hypothetical protein [Amycolatopsis sp. CA-230715]QWF81863.1 hypothetical protein HUW46_05296 [Amycolatopsis sp. CA-230715]
MDDDLLTDVADAQELWRLLVTVTSLRSLAPSVAVDAFRRLHEAGQPGAGGSALLLCTDPRWRRTSARVLADIVATGILDDAELDRLAEELLWSRKVRYAHPLSWIGSTSIEFDLDSSRHRMVREDPNTQVTAERDVPPPLRSWAAERVLVRKLAAPADVLARTRALPPREGAAVATGAVNAADELDAEQARMVVEFALQGNHGTSRKAALERLASWGEVERAEALAADDADATIREWGRDLRTESPTQGGLFD